MKHYVIFMSIILGMIAPSVCAQTVKQKVAVYVTGDVEAGYKKVIGSKLVTGITRSEGYAAVERTADFLAELTKEQDYQMSGAVSDNQIARLGQQFGVRYVLVADISEVFESMFISARMIDVQTAQITNSTESNAVVGSMENLSNLAEKIALAIVGAPIFSEDAVKQTKVSTFDNLRYCSVPNGYHIATYDEIDKIIKNYQMTGKKLSFPIYTNISSSSRVGTQDFTVDCVTGKNEKVYKTLYKSRSFAIYVISCSIIQENGTISPINLSYNDDDFYYSDYARWNQWMNGRDRYKSRGDLMYMSTDPPTISSGYVYFVKDE